MLLDIVREIIELTKDRQFTRNVNLLALLTFIFSGSLAVASVSPERLTQQEKIEQFSNLMTVGISMRTKMVLRQF